MVASILLRMTQVGFLSLGHSYGVAVQSVIIVSLAYLFTSILVKAGWKTAPEVGVLMGHLVSIVIIIPAYLWLMHMRKTKDRESVTGRIDNVPT